MSSDTVLFVHVPKTGGITLGCSLRWQYGSRHTFTTKWNQPDASNPFESLSESSVRRIRLVKGHVCYGLHEHLPQSCTYITMLRHPVPRVLSLYHFVQSSWPDSPAGSASLREFLTGSFSAYIPNDQTRRLSGLAIDDGSLPPEALDIAKENLDTEFAAFGTTERFDETLELMRRRLQWSKPPFYVRTNVGRSRPTQGDIDPALVDLIREQNTLDLQLYDTVTDRFDALIAEEGPGFHDDVERFQTMNGICQKAARLPLRAFRKTRSVARALLSD